MTPSWVLKHTELLPSAFISFFILPASSTGDGQKDTELISEINKMKSVITSSPYKTRLVIVLLSERSILQSPEVEDRTSQIRRSCGLDSKNSIFFVPPNTSPVELEAFVQTLISTLRPLTVEYYRDLSKHARRKRGRSTIPLPTEPPISGTSKTLSQQGWDVRYEFKMGVLAEFRQEYDAALRSYDNAYDTLFGQEMFESIANWSPRWNEARLLADIIAIRLIRCSLMSQQHTMAARRWKIHLERIRDIVDRQGKGTTNYGWEAWQARWARILGDLIIQTKVPELTVAQETKSIEGLATLSMYVEPEKSLQSVEQITPWERLHHPGYWFALSTRHLRARRDLARQLPEEDRAPPGRSPASSIASRAYTNDTYLCSDPHVEYPLPGEQGLNHQELIISSIEDTISQYRQRGLGRQVEQLQIELADEMMLNNEFSGAQKILKLLWTSMSWRTEGWAELAQLVGIRLWDCASKAGDGGTVLAIQWELSNRLYPLVSSWKYDLPSALDHVQNLRGKPALVLQSEEITSFLSADFTFRHAQGHVGDAVAAQLVIKSFAHVCATPITLNEVLIEFDHGLRHISLQHNKSVVSEQPLKSLTQQSVSFEESSADQSRQPDKQKLAAYADLCIRPGQTAVYDLKCALKEDGPGHCKSITVSVATEKFDLDYIIALGPKTKTSTWWSTGSGTLRPMRISRERAHEISILPKPPKVQLNFLGSLKEYFTNESVPLVVDIQNDEDESAHLTLTARLLGDTDEQPSLSWAPGEAVVGQDVSTAEGSEVSLPDLEPGSNMRYTCYLKAPSEPVDYIVEIKAIYKLASDSETLLTKVLTTNISIIHPFEMHYDFSPRKHPDSWPSFFSTVSTDTSESHATGLIQRWCLTTSALSTATQSIEFGGMDLVVTTIHGGATCKAHSDGPFQPPERLVSPGGARELKFVLDIQRSTMEDRRSSTLDLELTYKWRRKSDHTFTSSTIAVPRLLVPSGEPRVLASSLTSPIASSSLSSITLFVDFTFENPTMHLLTFAISMDSSDDFGFSGPKMTSLQLLPLSRHTIRYILFPLVRGIWIQPHLRVVDRYFNKVLKVSATEGMKVDKKGILVWVDAED
jgi:hypothetical protein